MTEPPLRERESARASERENDADDSIASLGALFLDVSSAQVGERAEERAEREERGERGAYVSIRQHTSAEERAEREERGERGMAGPQLAYQVGRILTYADVC